MLPVWFCLLTLFFCCRPICPESLFFQSLEEEKNPEHSSDSTVEVVPVTPDVDLLLQCSFSYMHQGAECDRQEQKPGETFLNSTAPEEDKEEVGFSFYVSFLSAVSFSSCDGAGPLSTCSFRLMISHLFWQPMKTSRCGKIMISLVISSQNTCCLTFLCYWQYFSGFFLNCHDCEQIIKSLIFVLPSTHFWATKLSSVVVETVACLCEQAGDKAPPAAVDDQMYYSTVSSLDRKDSFSSDEDGDIYCQSGRDVTICAPNKTDKTSDRQLAPGVLNRGSHKADQVGFQHQF